MKNLFQCIHHSVLRQKDRHPGATLYNVCLLPGSGWAAAACEGRRGAVLELLREAQPGQPSAVQGLACPGVSSEQECVSHCLAGARGVSALCLTRSDRDLPTRLLLPRSSFSCSVSQPSTASESPSKAE